MEFDPAAIQTGSLVAYLLVFAGGLVTSIGPCNLAMIPLVVSYVGGSPHLPRRRAFALSLAFTAGLALTLVALGVAAALVGGLVDGLLGASHGSRLWTYLLAAVCLLVGLHMLGALPLPPLPGPVRLRERISLRGAAGALALGLVSGLVASQCATPVLAAILAYVLARPNSLAYGAILLFVYALGRGLPILLAGTFTGALKELPAAGRWSSAIERASGVVMLALGVYFLWTA